MAKKGSRKGLDSPSSRLKTVCYWMQFNQGANMKDMTASELQWAMSRLEGNKAMLSPKSAEAITIARYLIDVIVTRADICCDSPAAEIIPKIESLIFQARHESR